MNSSLYFLDFKELRQNYNIIGLVRHLGANESLEGQRQKTFGVIDRDLRLQHQLTHMVDMQQELNVLVGGCCLRLDYGASDLAFDSLEAEGQRQLGQLDSISIAEIFPKNGRDDQVN